MSTCLAERPAAKPLQRGLATPRELISALPASEAVQRVVDRCRRSVRQILERRDPRLLAIVGPCSVHNCAAALEYARRLRGLAARCAEHLSILMRVYVDKPRTTIGWRGLLLDPRLDGSGRVEEGVWEARELLLRIGELGLGVATEFVDPLLAFYLQDLVSWAAIGARTAESQIHRELASDLPMPVGFKNTTTGCLEAAANAMVAAARPWHRVTIDEDGRLCVRRTAGNRHAHLVLRGSENGCNCDEEGLVAAARVLERRGFRPVVLVDCSHGNSGKDASRQEEALRTALGVRNARAARVAGFMLESNLAEGRQEWSPGAGQPAPELSITDPCLGWERTERLVLSLCYGGRGE